MFKIPEGYHLTEALHVQKAAKTSKQAHHLRMLGCLVAFHTLACHLPQ